jgi:hypothetical protein
MAGCFSKPHVGRSPLKANKILKPIQTGFPKVTLLQNRSGCESVARK